MDKTGGIPITIERLVVGLASDALVARNEDDFDRLCAAQQRLIHYTSTGTVKLRSMTAPDKVFEHKHHTDDL